MKIFRIYRLMILGPLLGILGLNQGCSKVFDKVAGEIVRYRLDGINDFQGIMSQRTLVTPKDQAIETRIRFKKPHYFSSEVITPAEYAGYRISSDGRSFTVYRPWDNTAYRAVGLTPMNPEETQQMIQRASREITENFTFEAIGPGDVGTRPTNVFKITSSAANSRKTGGRVQLDRATLFPLEILITDEQGYHLYHYLYKQIVFNCGLTEGLFQEAIPPGTLIHTWDFGKPALSPDKAMEIIGESIRLPRQLPEGFTLKGIYLSETTSATDPPLVLMDFGTRPSWLQIVQRKCPQGTTAASKSKPLPLYIPLLTKQGFARYYPTAGAKFVNWEQGGHEFTLLSNLPLLQIVDLIDGMTP